MVLNPAEVRVVTRRQPTKEELEDMFFAMTVVKHVKSNAIVVTRGRQLIGAGAGQMNRVGSVRIALQQAGDKARGAVRVPTPTPLRRFAPGGGPGRYYSCGPARRFYP